MGASSPVRQQGGPRHARYDCLSISSELRQSLARLVNEWLMRDGSRRRWPASWRGRRGDATTGTKKATHWRAAKGSELGRKELREEGPSLRPPCEHGHALRVLCTGVLQGCDAGPPGLRRSREPNNQKPLMARTGSGAPDASSAGALAGRLSSRRGQHRSGAPKVESVQLRMRSRHGGGQRRGGNRCKKAP